MPGGVDPVRSITRTSSPVRGRGAGATAPGVPAGTNVPSIAIWLPASCGDGTGIWQLSTDPAVCANAGRTVTTVDTATAPSASMVRRVGSLSGAPASCSCLSSSIHVSVTQPSFNRSKSAANRAGDPVPNGRIGEE